MPQAANSDHSLPKCVTNTVHMAWGHNGETSVSWWALTLMRDTYALQVQPLQAGFVLWLPPAIGASIDMLVGSHQMAMGCKQLLACETCVRA